ncbi:MAG: DUF420 domain-containing protein [Deltaproteobacteria bacterium]|nr:DUF420 domain-containing protein [Deltaproteobacteria bacterium]
MTAEQVAREILPTLNACLNGTSALLVFAAWIAIRRKSTRVHRALMLAALGCSTAFLASYLTRMSLVGSVSFTGAGAAKVVYLVILFSHMVLAAVVVPLVLVTLVQALRSRFPQHRRIARFTLPVWLYVSVTGVVVYLMLYHWPRADEPAPASTRAGRDAAVESAETTEIPGKRSTLAALTWPGRPGMVGALFVTPRAPRGGGSAARPPGIHPFPVEGREP